MRCPPCLRGRLSPLTARLLFRAPDQSAVWTCVGEKRCRPYGTQILLTSLPSAEALGYALSRLRRWLLRCPFDCAKSHRVLTHTLAPGQSAARKSFPRTKFKFATWALAPTLSPKRREGWGTQSLTFAVKPRQLTHCKSISWC